MSKTKLKRYLYENIKKPFEGVLTFNNKTYNEFLCQKTGIESHEAEIILKLIDQKFKEDNKIDVKILSGDLSILIDIFILGMTNLLTDDGKLTIPNFGSFKIKESKARIARNPKTGEKVQLPDLVI